MDRLKCGGVGAVARGSEFVGTLMDHPNAEVVALRDVQEEALGAVAARFGVERTFTDYERMLDETPMDAVIVATPMPLHAPQAAVALQRDLHVFSEVSACVSMEQARDLAGACRTSG